MYKMKICGANAIFGLHMQINLGAGMITAVATGTAVSLHGLPVAATIPPTEDDPPFIKEYHARREAMVSLSNLAFLSLITLPKLFLEHTDDESEELIDESSGEEDPKSVCRYHILQRGS